MTFTNKLLIALLASIAIPTTFAQTNTLVYQSDGVITKSLKNQGTYSSSTAYVANDFVVYNGVGYYASQASTGQTPATGSSYWTVLSSGSGGGVTSVYGRTGAVTLTSGDVTTALGYTPSQSSGIAHVTPASAEYAFSGSNTSTTTEPDVTGNGNTATLSSGGLTRLQSGGVKFDGTGYMTTPVTAFRSLGYRVCTYGPYASGDLAQAPNFSSLWGPSGSGGSSVMMVGSATGSNATYTISPAIFDTNAFGTNASDVDAGCHTYFAVADTVWRFYKDGYEVQYQSQLAPGSNTLSSGGYLIGSGVGNASQFGIKATMMYLESFGTAVLTPTQVLAETNYINSRAGSDPYRVALGTSRTSAIVFQGDSITNGNGANPYPNQLTLNNTYNIINKGVGSERAQSISVNHKLQAWNNLTPNASKCYSSYFDGTNDIGVAGQSPAVTWSSIRKAAIEDLTQTSCDVLIFTMLDRNGSTSQHDTLNGLIRSGVPTMGPRAHLVDVAAIPLLGADGAAPSNGIATTYWTADGIHPTTAGHALIADVVSRVVNSADGSVLGNSDIITSNSFVETDANNYIIQTPTAAATHQLSNSLGITNTTHTIVNNSAFAITVSAGSGDSVRGSTAVPANTVAVFRSTLVSPAAGGNYWLRVQ